MGTKIDARGLSCPQPVVLTRQALGQGEISFEVIVNSEVSKENVLRLLEKNSFKVNIRMEGDDIFILASR